jgi:hypothetical protein
MHDPHTQAFQIPNFFYRKDKWGYRKPLITIWHVDPERDGTDDSCGWFIRPRHADMDIYEKIVKEFESEWDRTFKGETGHVYNCGWFNPEGENILSVYAIVFNMYLYTSKIVINSYDKINPGKAWDKAWKFMNKHRDEITYFAENNRDSMRDVIVRKFEIGCDVKYTPEKRMEMIRDCASIIYTDVLRKMRKWWQHPKWHIHHWSIQFHPLQDIKRRYWDKCCICGKRGFKGAAMSGWNGTKRWHQECDTSTKMSPIELTNTK